MDWELPDAEAVGEPQEFSVNEPQEVVVPENSKAEEANPSDAEQETTQPDAQELSRKLIESVGNPARINNYEKGLYVEENLLEVDGEKKPLNEKEKKINEIDLWLSNDSNFDGLGISDPLADNETVLNESPLDEEIVPIEGDAPSFDEIPL